MPFFDPPNWSLSIKENRYTTFCRQFQAVKGQHSAPYPFIFFICHMLELSIAPLIFSTQRLTEKVFK